MATSDGMSAMALFELLRVVHDEYYDENTEKGFTTFLISTKNKFGITATGNPLWWAARAVCEGKAGGLALAQALVKTTAGVELINAVGKGCEFDAFNEMRSTVDRSEPEHFLSSYIPPLFDSDEEEEEEEHFLPPLSD